MKPLQSSPGGAGIAIEHVAVSVAADSVLLEGDLSVPTSAAGVVLFAHGSGSSRHSPRNRYVADLLNDAGLATLLIDLLTPDEDALDQRTGHLRFDIPMLASRLVAIVDWLKRQAQTVALPVG